MYLKYKENQEVFIPLLKNRNETGGIAGAVGYQ